MLGAGRGMVSRYTLLVPTARNPQEDWEHMVYPCSNQHFTIGILTAQKTFISGLDERNPGGWAGSPIFQKMQGF